ncbi:hypothetical protein [Aeromicrobium sp. CnD17-E]|uniref:hypothetical protein n=1 Tax=Aeromicrobium sp. CnD17-E TaxID=2954487 RepID=UPI002097D536|nr:hypothetical protein [Aeromicrobium sp. CnD17-E]MCO7238696.1 hypothetical protein [Aeromicrobium sp. CnD17-E]
MMAAATIAQERPKLVAECRRLERERAEWIRARELAEDRRTDLDEGLGAMLLDAHDEVPSALNEMRRAEVDIDLARRALQALEPRLSAARTAALENFAQEYDVRAEDARARLLEHEAATRKIVQRLERHAGSSVPAPPSAKSGELKKEIHLEELRAAMIRDVASDRDPAKRISELITSGLIDADFDQRSLYTAAIWGPAAIKPARAFRLAVDRAEAMLAAHQAEMARDDDEIIAEWNKKVVDWDERATALAALGEQLSPEDREAQQYCADQAVARTAWRENAEHVLRSLRQDFLMLTASTVAAEG